LSKACPASSLQKEKNGPSTSSGKPARDERELQPLRTATTASTSTATPSGRTGTPTALRAWRPASPNTSCISSDAPVGHLGLVDEAAGAVHEHAQLHDPLDPVETDRLLDLREQHDAARPRGGDARLQVHVLAEPALDQLPILLADLPEMCSSPFVSTAGT
jgi:hypothetical protein